MGLILCKKNTIIVFAKSQSLVLCSFKMIGDIDLFTLRPNGWLNDIVINSYYSHIQTRSVTLNQLAPVLTLESHFWTRYSEAGIEGVRRWTRQANFDEIDLFFVPRCSGLHWTVAACDLRRKRISWYDSLPNDHTDDLNCFTEYLANILNNPAVPLWPKFSVESPQQRNGDDCGVCAILNAEFLSRREDLSYLTTPESINCARESIRSHLVRGFIPLTPWHTDCILPAPEIELAEEEVESLLSPTDVQSLKDYIERSGRQDRVRPFRLQISETQRIKVYPDQARRLLRDGKL